MKTLFFFLLPVILNCQEFLTSIIVSNNIGQSDTIQLGYDQSASIGFDQIWGEFDIQNIEFDTEIDVRLAQLHYGKIDCIGNNTSTNKEVLRFMTKKDIIRNDCLAINSENVSTLLINNKYLPVTISWNKSQFQDSCLTGSLLTDWHPGGWFDASICPTPNHYFSRLENSDNLTIDLPTPIFMTHGSDTLSMIFIALQPHAPVNVNEYELSTVFVFPNPTNNILKIEKEGQSLINTKLYNSSGKLLYEGKKQEIDMTNMNNGIYYLQIINKNKIVGTKQIIKYSH